MEVFEKVKDVLGTPIEFGYSHWAAYGLALPQQYLHYYQKASLLDPNASLVTSRCEPPWVVFGEVIEQRDYIDGRRPNIPPTSADSQKGPNTPQKEVSKNVCTIQRRIRHPVTTMTMRTSMYLRGLPERRKSIKPSAKSKYIRITYENRNTIYRVATQVRR